jgi:hypothetical protein
MTPNLLAYWLNDILPKIFIVDGIIFLDRLNREKDGILDEISTYDSLIEAQKWINIVPWDNAFNDLIGDNWSITDADIERVMDIFKRCMELYVATRHDAAPHSVEIWRDDDLGEIGLIVRAV